MDTKKLVILGAGGFGREVVQYVNDINSQSKQYDILGFVDDDPLKRGQTYDSVPVIGDLSSINTREIEIYAVCAIAKPALKKEVVERAYDAGLKFINLVHPTVYLSGSVSFGEGIIISPYCVISVDTFVGSHAAINPQCGIGHDAHIGDFSTLYWNVNISGNVKLGNCVEVGSKAFIKQGLNIGDDAVIGALAAVIRNVEPNTTVAGVPAKKI